MVEMYKIVWKQNNKQGTECVNCAIAKNENERDNIEIDLLMKGIKYTCIKLNLK